MRALLALLACALAPAAAHSRPFTVQDLLQTESLGQVMMAPSERWAVVEHRRPWREAAKYDLNLWTPLRLTRLEFVDLDHPGPATPLFDQTPDAGYVAGPIAPDGAHMLVYRLQGRAFEAGVLALDTRKVIWLPLLPDQPIYGRAAQWRNATTLLLLARADSDMPRQLAIPWRAQERRVQGSARTAEGRSPSRVRLGSGRFLEVKAERPPSLLMAVDAQTGALRPLAEGEFIDLEVAPGGRTAALIENRAETQDRPQDRVYIGLPSRKRRLDLVDLDTAVLSKPCGEADLALNLLAWSPSGGELLAALRPAGGAWDARQPVRVSSRTCEALPMGDLAPVYERSGEDQIYLRATWMGENPILLARAGLAGRADWYRLGGPTPTNLTSALPAAAGALAGLGPGRLALLNAGGLWSVTPDGSAHRDADVAGPTPILRSVLGQDRVRNDPTPPGPDTVWIEDGGASLVWRPPHGPPRRARLPARSTVIATTPRAALAVTSAADGQAALSVITARGATPVLPLNAAYAGIIPPEIVPIHHAGPKGEPLTSWLYLPADRPPGAKLTLVVIPYRGQVFAKPPPHLALGNWNESANAQILVGAGYAVLAPSLPYDAASGEPARGLADDILRAVDAALTRGDLDPDRIALFGHSFGGMSVVNAAIQSPRFKTVIASAGLYDFVSNWGIFPLHQAAVPQDGYAPNLTNGITEQAQSGMGAPPWADPQRYLRNSALFQADRITAPILLFHGETDELGAFQSQELFSALYRQGKDAELVTYWGEGHNTSSPANIVDRYAIILDWLKKTLPPGDASSGPTPQR